MKSAIWLYEVERARDPYALMRYDSSGRVSKGMFPEDWTRYVMKIATGAGKTKVMSLLMAWSYFHKLYEPDSELSTNFLLIAPNIIVLDRLRTDFDGLSDFLRRPDPAGQRLRGPELAGRFPVDRCIFRTKSDTSADRAISS